MVGVCGVLGPRSHGPERMLESLRWSDDEQCTKFLDDDVCLAGTFHDLLAGESPARAADGDVLVWVWGDVYGHFGADGHVPRAPTDGASDRYVADLYDDRNGDVDWADLNGDYLAVLYDRPADTVTFVTDRVATRPVYYTTLGDGTLVFSSNVQSLVTYPGVDVKFDVEYLHEYLSLRRVFGVKTPIRGVEELPPATAVTVDVHDGSMTERRYWRPTHRPTDASCGERADHLADLFERVVTEWTDDDLDYGLLLSGGSDSRMTLAAMDQPVTAFHAAEWESAEAAVAERVADAAGADFHLLERGERYRRRALEENPDIANFSGWFDQAYFTGFADEMREEVDVLVSGLYSDMLFKGGQLANPRVSLGPLGSVSLPVWKGVDSVGDYVDQQTASVEGPPGYVSPPLDVGAVIENNVERDGSRVVSHGVTYESLHDLVMYGDFFPMGADTDAIFSRSLMQTAPYRTPFLDARVLEFQQGVQLNHLLRRNLVHRAIERLDPDLAAVPHSRTGVPLKYPHAVDQVGDNLNAFRRKYLSNDDPPEPHLTHGPWTDRREVIRHESFLREHLEEREYLVREMPFLEYEGVQECLRAHEDGEDNTAELYALATFLGTPAVQRARESEPLAANVSSGVGAGPPPVGGLTGGEK